MRGWNRRTPGHSCSGQIPGMGRKTCSSSQIGTSGVARSTTWILRSSLSVIMLLLWGEICGVRGTVSRSQMDHIEEFVKYGHLAARDLFRRIDISADGYIGVPASRDLPAAMAFSGERLRELLPGRSQREDAGPSIQRHSLRGAGRGMGPQARQRRCKRHCLCEGPRVAELVWSRVCGDSHQLAAGLLSGITFMGFNIAVSSMLQTLSNDYSCGIMAGDLSYVQRSWNGRRQPHGCQPFARVCRFSNYYNGRNPFETRKSGRFVEVSDAVEELASLLSRRRRRRQLRRLRKMRQD